MRSPAGHWKMLALLVVVIATILVLEGITTQSHSPGNENRITGGPKPLAGTGPIYSSNGEGLQAYPRRKGRALTLTFDDGPDPRWTPQISAMLRAHGIHATFFVVGSEAIRHPGIIRQLVRDGHEVANHTFSHASLADSSRFTRQVELQLTEAALAGTTGRFSRFVRPPYSATPKTVTPADERALASAAGTRYLVALSDIDTRDWERPGTQAIADALIAAGRTGGVVLLHDGGGDRSQTVEALRLALPQMHAEGARFVSLSRIAHLPSVVSKPPVDAWLQARGTAFVWSAHLALLFVEAVGVLLIGIGILIVLRALLVLVLATYQARQRRRELAVRTNIPDDELPSVVVLVPAYNEEVGIERAVRSLAGGDYPGLEVVVIDDGSKDDTAAIVERLSIPNVRLIRQDNGGKAAALNTGIDHTDAEIVVMVDGDTLFEPDTIRRLVAPMVDPEVGAVSGNTKVGNRGGMLGRWQHIEYVMGFNLDRRMYEVLQCTPTVPGAIGAFRRSVLEAVGGVPADTLAEDTDLTLAIGRTGAKVMYADDARAWTEAPSTFTALWRQRYRWSFGTMQAVWKHRGAMISRAPNDRRIGRRALPYMIAFQIILPVIAPLIDLFALHGLLFSDAERIGMLWLAFNAVQLLIAAYGFWLDDESLKPLWALPLQQFVYRQLMYLVIIESTVSAIKGARSGWKHLPRTGDAVIAAPSTAS